jgi:hypothetical protein
LAVLSTYRHVPRRARNPGAGTVTTWVLVEGVVAILPSDLEA